MKSSRLIRAALGVALVAVLAACGSTEKTADQKPSSAPGGAGSLVGITMPTRSRQVRVSTQDREPAMASGMCISGFPA